MPEISVLIPVHNSQNFLEEAVDSVLNQSFKDFECIIIDDGSTDNSKSIIKKISDRRVKKIFHSKKQGIVKTLNYGIKIAQGKYIARMDGDDICLPHRFQTQINYLQSRPEVGVCGSWLEVFGKQNYIWKTEVDHNSIQARALFETPIGHPTVIMRKSMLTKFKLSYRETYKYAEDYDLWVRATKCTKFHCIAEPLVRYRVHDNQTGQAKKLKQQDNTNKIRMKQLADLGIKPTKIHQKIMAALGSWQPYPSYNHIKNLLNQISSANSKKQIYDQRSLDIILVERWLGTMSLYEKSPFKRIWHSMNPGFHLISPALKLIQKRGMW